MGKSTYNYDLTRGDDDIEIEVEVDITSYGHNGSPATFHHPGDPPEGPEFEILEVTNLETNETLDPPLTPEEEALVSEFIGEKIQEEPIELNEPDEPDYD